MDNWINTVEENTSIVLSSTVEISRNIKDIFFPHKLDNIASKKIIKNIEEVFYSSIGNKDEYKTFYLWEQDKLKYIDYLDKNIITDKILLNKEKSAFIVNKDETISIMFNEQDHIKIKCITGGFRLDDVYKTSQNIDDKLEQKLEYAFDEKLGYLTACPTNIGTGFKAEVIIHLPALHITNEINGVLNALAQVGMTIRGLYGAGSKCSGSIFKIYNQLTLGLSEREIINNLTVAIEQIMNEEQLCRNKLLSKYKYEIKDRIYRSLGILKSAVLLDIDECLRLLSYVRFGIEMNMIDSIKKKTINELMISIHPTMLDKIYNKNIIDKLGSVKRAELIKNKLYEVID